MTATQSRWTKDYTALTDALKPHTIAYDDGFVAVDETTADPTLTSLYRKMVQIGYANGWL